MTASIVVAAASLVQVWFFFADIRKFAVQAVNDTYYYVLDHLGNCVMGAFSQYYVGRSAQWLNAYLSREHQGSWGPSPVFPPVLALVLVGVLWPPPVLTRMLPVLSC